MQISQPGQQPPASNQATASAIKAWVTGQLLKAVVTQVNTQQGLMSLRVQNIQFQLPLPSAQLNLKQGQQVQLEVTKSGVNPQVKLITTTANGMEQTQAKPATVTNARVIPPQQGNLAQPTAQTTQGGQATSQNQGGTASASATQNRAQPQNITPNQTSNTQLASPQRIVAQNTPITPLAVKPVPPLSTPEKQTIQQAQKVDLPRQIPIPSLLANLNSVANPSANKALPLPPQLVNFIRSTLASLATHQEIQTPEGLKKAINNSGLFLENRLLKNEPNLAQQDLKAIILKLAQQLKQLPELRQPPAPQSAPTQTAAAPQSSASPATPQSPTTPYTKGGTGEREINLGRTQAQVQSTPPPSVNTMRSTEQIVLELAKQADSSASRIQLNQTTMIGSEEPGKMAFNFEIPIRNGNQSQLINICIKREQEQEKEGGEGKVSPWSVSLALDLEKLGPVRILLTLYGKKISSTFWAEQASTTQIFEDHINTLKENMEEAGLEVGNMHCHTGTPPPETEQEHQTNQSILDEKA